MNYIGSKHKLVNFLKDEISAAIAGSMDNMVFCDLFAGTGIVGRSFKSSVKKIISNDIEEYGYVLNKNYIENSFLIENKYELIKELNSLPTCKKGFIYDNYCLGGGNGRQYFSDDNGKKIDAIRYKIREWKESAKINENEYYFLLASLLESADKVANTASVYGSFLKRLKRSAQRELVLEAALFEADNGSHKVYKEDANSLVKKIKGDILYIDPPYNHREYGANYHLLNTIALYDDFVPKGKTGVREYKRSAYCKRKKAFKALEELVASAKFRYIFLSYNNEGIISKEEIRSIMIKYGIYDQKIKKYERLRTNRTDKSWVHEQLHILRKEEF